MSSPSSSTILQILASSVQLSQSLQNALAGPSLPIFHRSHWRCLACSYSAVIQALIVLFTSACSYLEPLEREIMCRRLTPSLCALHQALQEGLRCMQESLPSNSDSTHSWLVEKALKLGMSTDVVDLHLRRLLWSSSVVREQILRYAQIDGIEVVISNETRDLCEIWAQVDAQDDFLAAQIFLNRIMGEEEGEPHQLASFILQKLSFAENLGRIIDSDDLPLFLWVDPDDLKRNPEIRGEGGCCKVQEAIWLGGRFAVKDFFYIENNLMFRREAAIQSQLCHPNVIPLVCCTTNPSLCKCSLVIELMQQDLRVLMIQRKNAGMDPPFPLLLAVDLMLQIAEGMEYLHSLRIIHRDLKSSNILVSFSNSAGVSNLHANDVSPHVHLKVGDFGMSRAKDASSRYTSLQIGSTRWRAPEAFDEVEGDHPNARYTNKVDVYSFGLVCYEILTGKSPFEGFKLTQIRRRVLAGDRPRLPTQCPMALSSYIERCWHAEPDERPTFTQICRMLRYLKACILMGDHDHDNFATDYHNSLVHPLSTTMCAGIDDMLGNQVQQCGAILRPQLLVIPLEMYCCRVVLQQFRDETEVNSNQLHGESSHVLSDEVSPGTAAGGYERSSSTLQDQRNGVRVVESRRRTAQGYLNGTLKQLKKLLICIKGTEQANPDLRNALGLVGQFTYGELRIATDNFSSLIGQGGFGSVYSGRLADGRRIAVKTLGNTPQCMLTQELRIASQLRHRNLVPLFGWCQDAAGKLHLVYEYMPNGDLAKHIFERGESVVGWQQRYKIVCQLAAALKYLHQDSGYRQIVHRDIKMANIMLDSEWNARLGDCGLAVLLEEGHFALEDVAGTCGYLAPEAVIQSIVSPAADIYSFGVTILEIATGRRTIDFIMAEIDSGSRRIDFRMTEIAQRQHSTGFQMIQIASEVQQLPLRLWVWDMYEEGKVMGASDVRLRGNFDEMEMERLLVLGLVCTNRDWRTRPSIEEVLRILSASSQPPPPQPWSGSD